jgi:arsenate reductase
MSETFPVTIYHNPDCGTSRNALAMIGAAGHAPHMVDNRGAGWTHGLLEELLAAVGARPRDVLRVEGTAAVARAPERSVKEDGEIVRR